MTHEHSLAICSLVTETRGDGERHAESDRKQRLKKSTSAFLRITRIARAAGCDLKQVSNADPIAALKPLTLPFQGAVPRTGGAPQRVDQNRETETAHGPRRRP